MPARLPVNDSYEKSYHALYIIEKMGAKRKQTSLPVCLCHGTLRAKYLMPAADSQGWCGQDGPRSWHEGKRPFQSNRLA